ncbi:hypothetical protein DSECCO2_601000 [anaerobic digester metagenome]
MMDRLNTAIRNDSAGPNFSTRRVTSGATVNNSTAPTIPPIKDDIVDRPSAISPLPCWAIGYPSNTVAPLAGVPGVLSKMAEMEPP